MVSRAVHYDYPFFGAEGIALSSTVWRGGALTSRLSVRLWPGVVQTARAVGMPSDGPVEFSLFQRAIEAIDTGSTQRGKDGWAPTPSIFDVGLTFDKDPPSLVRRGGHAPCDASTFCPLFLFAHRRKAPLLQVAQMKP